MLNAHSTPSHKYDEETANTSAGDQHSNSSSARNTNLRWFALALASFLVFGNDYCYDLPQALETEIESKFGIDEVQYNLLYSVYSLPNIILPFFGGYILDYFGVKVGVLLYVTLIISGQALFTLGCYTGNFDLLVLGRCIYGIGDESLNVAQSTIVTMWFKGKELTTALGISLCVCRLGSSLNSYLSPLLYSQFGDIAHVSMVGLAFLMLSLACGIGLIIMDSKYFKNEKVENNEKIAIKDITSLKPNFWFLYLNGILCFMSFFPFLNIANKYLQRRFDLETTFAGELLIIPYCVAGLLTPILSYLIDKKGKKASLLIFACMILAFNHFSLADFANCDGCTTVIIPLIVFGIFFALYTSLFPSVSIIADEKVIGTAMGIIYSGQNTGLAIGPLIVGSMLNDEKLLLTEYTRMSEVLGLFAALAVADAILNWWWDKKFNGRVLQKNMQELADSSKTSNGEVELVETEK